jgi:peptide/nickel transport system substrate-binding protein
MKKFFPFLMVFVLLISLRSTASQNQNILRIGLTQEYETFHPLTWMNDVTFYVMNAVHRQPVYLNVQGQWVSDLVETIPSEKNGLLKKNPAHPTEKMTATWTIKKEVKWGDGTPITCKDLELAWKIGNTPTVSIGSREDYQNISRVSFSAKTPKKCEVGYKKLNWNFYKSLPSFVPAHLESTILESHKGKNDAYSQNSNYSRNPLNPGLYNGPYLVEEFKFGSHVTLKTNPHFYGKKPFFEKVVFKIIPNTAALESNLTSKTIDLISTVGLTLDQALLFERKSKTQKLPYKVQIKPSLKYEHIDLNLDHPALAQKEVRQALLLGINREELIQALFQGRVQMAHHFLPPMDPFYTENPKQVRLYSYSPEKAEELLEKAGWLKNSRGLREKNGQNLSLTFMTTSGDRMRDTVQAYLKDQWRKIGVEVLIKNEPARVLIADTLQKRKFPALIMYYWTSTPESSRHGMFHSSQIPSDKNAFTGMNYPGWTNKIVDQELEKIDRSFTPSARKQALHKIIGEYTEELPVLPLYYRSDNAVLPANLEGFEITGHYFSETYRIEHWHYK